MQMIVNSTLLLLVRSHWNERIVELVAIRNVRQTQTLRNEYASMYWPLRLPNYGLISPRKFQRFIHFSTRTNTLVYLIYLDCNWFCSFFEFFCYFMFRTFAFGIVFLVFVDYSVACKCIWNVFSGTNGKKIEHENHIQSESGSM